MADFACIAEWSLCIVLVALVWQLMKAYTLSILTKLAGQDAQHPIVEREIVAWANEKVRKVHAACHISL